MIIVEKNRTHGDKLNKLMENGKLDDIDKPRVKEAIEVYDRWISDLESVDGTQAEILGKLVKLVNDYKTYIDLNFIFDSPDDFLYRQKGQLKLDNTILEEFLPWLFDVRLVPGFERLSNIEVGPQGSYAGLSFTSPYIPLNAGGAFVKKKNQDFAVSRNHKISIAQVPASDDTFVADVAVSYFATEIKTNLDKTMFQEASQTAGELKRAVSGAKYILLCEWLDMTPINTKLTPIDEVIILRKAKRVNSNVRDEYSEAANRKKVRSEYAANLAKYPLQLDCFERFIAHLNDCFPIAPATSDSTVLTRGYF